MFDKISTRDERLIKKIKFLDLLLGDRSSMSITIITRKKPFHFPKGLNYTPKEWNIINSVATSSKVSINDLFELEQIINNPKYKDHIILNELRK